MFEAPKQFLYIILTNFNDFGLFWAFWEKCLRHQSNSLDRESAARGQKSCTCTPLNISNTCFEIADKKLIFCLQMRIINTSVVFWRLTLFAAWFKFVVVKKKVAFTPFSNLNTCDEFPEKKGFLLLATNENYQNFCHFWPLTVY